MAGKQCRVGEPCGDGKGGACRCKCRQRQPGAQGRWQDQNQPDHDTGDGSCEKQMGCGSLHWRQKTIERFAEPEAAQATEKQTEQTRHCTAPVELPQQHADAQKREQKLDAGNGHIGGGSVRQSRQNEEDRPRSAEQQGQQRQKPEWRKGHQAPRK